MEAVVIIFAGLRDIAHLFEAVRAHEADEGGRFLVDVFRLRHERLGLRLNILLYKRREVFVCFAFRQMLAGVLHGFKEVQTVPVDKIHIPRHKNLPAGGQRVVVCVLLLIAPAQQRGNDDLVVRILREAEALLRERCGQFVDGQGRVFVYAQVDLGIDEAQVAAGDQAQLGQLVIRIGAVLVRAAQYDRLPIVALLDADVKIAVTVTGDEKLFKLLECFVFCQKPRIQIVPVIGVQELVDAADGIVIVAVAPHGVVQQAQELQRLKKRFGRVRGNFGKRVRNGQVAHAQSLLTVARGEVRHDGKHVQHSLQKFLLLRCFRLFQLRADFFGP